MVAVLIDSITYNAYASVDTADDYINAAFGDNADSWRALSDDDTKARLLVTATRTLDRQKWKGTKTDADQALDWPRKETGITGVTNNTVPQDIVDASIEMAVALLGGSDLQNVQTTEQKVQSLKAGSVSLTYFRGADGVSHRFPQIIHELVAPYLAGASASLSSSSATGTGGKSVTNDDFGFTEGL